MPPPHPSPLPASSPAKGDLPTGVGAGPLSDAARRRLNRPGPQPLCPPPPDDHGAVARWRAAIHEAWQHGDPSAEACGHRVEMVGQVRCLRTAPAPGPIVVYFHGGGYALGSPEVALPITERLAQGLEVVSVDYRLAPEYPCPAGIDDGWQVAQALQRAEPGRGLVLAGDSAGANLALSVAIRLRDTGPGATGPGATGPGATGPGAAGLVLLSPHVDHGETGVPARRHPLDDLDEAGAAWLRSAYCGPLAPHDPLVSPIRAPLGGLPPVLVQAGTDDSSLTQAVALARRARAAGVLVTLDLWVGLWHTWHYHRDLPEADQALAEARQFASSVIER